MSWTQLADELGTDSGLKALDADGVAAVLDVLAVLVYADGRAGILERNEFAEQINALPWLAGKDPEAALAKAKAAGDDAGRQGILAAATKAISGKGVGAQVYRMAAELAHADHQLHRAESTLLMQLVAGLGLDEAEASKIDAQVG
ncbi:MAG: putative tellurite resistance protein B-like protein [Bradymonadia bacterium]|jgi:uncharacterized tellurite resistance protein B-like protein